MLIRSTTYETVTSIVNICLLFHCKLSLVSLSGLYEILKINKKEAQAIIYCLQKKDITPEEAGFKLLAHPPNPPDSAPSDLY